MSGSQVCNLSMHDGRQTTAHAFVVEAWSDRNDLGDKAAAKLLSTSKPMTFSFDDRGFNRGLVYELKAMDVAGAPGLVALSAQPNNATLGAMASLVTSLV